MDQKLSQLIPANRIGSDGFNWWVGQIEGTASDEENNKGGYRYKVAIVGDHPQDKKLLPTKNLPWATVMMPVNVPFMPGNTGGAHPQLIPGCWVIGFYLDNDKQKPIIMGSIGQVPGSTTVINEEDPNNDNRFVTALKTDSNALNPTTDGNPYCEKKDDGKVNTSGGGLSDGTKDNNDNQRVDLAEKKKASVKQEEWCQETAKKCEDQDLKSKMSGVIGQLLKDVQDSGGNIGTYYVNKYTGGLTNGIGKARSTVNKATYIVREFLARIKGYIASMLQKAVDALVKAILRPSETGNALTPVTEWFNKMLKDLGCKMADLGDRLAAWLTNVLMSYLSQIYRNAICQVDELVNGIISKIQQLLTELLNSILGPLSDILGAIAAPFNLIGNAINYVLKLLGISCSGPDQTCAKYKTVCTTGEKKEDNDEEGFLDGLLESLDNLFGDTPADYTQYVCEDAYTGKPLDVTTVGFTGGVPKLPAQKKVVYNINNVEVTEGDSAVFTVTRSGYLESSSSVTYKTLDKQGTATVGVDYLKEDGILGFNIGETEKTITVQTITDSIQEFEETFFIRLRTNSPVDDSDIMTMFTNNIGKGTIIEKDLKEPYDPYIADPVDPFEPIDDPSEDNFPDDPPGDDGSGDDTGIDPTPTYTVVANRTTCPEDAFIIYTITTTNVEDGSLAYYNLSGTNITSNDIIGGQLTGSFIINNNNSKVTVGIADDSTIEDEETLIFSITGKGASVDVLITADDLTIDDYDNGLGDSPETVFQDFRPPTVDIGDVITDDSGGIIEIPVDSPGDPWAEPPYVFIGGEGSGATATGLLDSDGFLTEIRVQSSGFGYKKNLAKDKGVRCIIDSFTILRPGIGYTTAPDLYINGELGIAEAVINDDGFVIGARILNREITFDRFPTINIVGGGGYGAKLLPSLACLDTDALATVGATKIGTGQYIDCP